MTFKVIVPEKIDTREVLDFLANVYGPTYDKAYRIFSSVFLGEPSFKPDNFILARETNGQLVGVMRIVEREIWVAGAKLTSGGISSVAVHPDWRRQGVCSAMMKRSVQEMSRRGMDISVLHGRKVLDGFYTRFGYRGIGRYIDLRFIDLTESPVLLKTEKYKPGHKKLCYRMYKKNYHSLPGSFNRSPAIWNWLLKRIESGVFPAVITIVKSGKIPAGYIVVKDQKLIEIAVPAKFYPAVISWFKHRNLESVSLHPGHPFFDYCRRHYSTIFQERRPLNGGYMMRAIKKNPRLEDICFHTSVLDEV